MTQFMIAHGTDPGPTQRPRLNGAICGTLAAAPGIAVMIWSGAIGGLAQSLELAWTVVLLLQTAAFAALGMIYGWIFSRAANDIRGGWLFGMAYGFLVWMLGPVLILQWWTDGPLVEGRAAMGLLGAHLAWGLCLGLLFPWVHRFIQRRLSDDLTIVRPGIGR